MKLNSLILCPHSNLKHLESAVCKSLFIFKCSSQIEWMESGCFLLLMHRNIRGLRMWLGIGLLQGTFCKHFPFQRIFILISESCFFSREWSKCFDWLSQNEKQHPPPNTYLLPQCTNMPLKTKGSEVLWHFLHIVKYIRDEAYNRLSLSKWQT